MLAFEGFARQRILPAVGVPDPGHSGVAQPLADVRQRRGGDLWTSFRRPPPHDQRTPPQTLPNIGERLSDAGVSWVWYSYGWEDALAGKAFEGQHPVPTYFKKYAVGTRENTQHVKDEGDFLASLDKKTLPAVSFITQLSTYDEHPAHATVQASEKHIVDLIEEVKRSPSGRIRPSS